MTVIPQFNNLIDETYSAVKLARYAQLADYAEDQFFGVFNPATQQEACKTIWTHRMRSQLAKYLREAQDEIELICGYPLSPRWIVDEPHPYAFPAHATWQKIIAAGIRGSTVISSGAVVSHAADPAVITAATTITDADEIRVYHPGTDIEIIPSAIAIAGGNVTISIPRARMVKAALQDNDEDGLAYGTTSNFEAMVDVKRIYNDTSTEGGLVWFHQSSSCDCSVCNGLCNDYAITACIYLRNKDTGAFDLLPAAYSGGVWTPSCSCYCSEPDQVRLNYLAGLTPLNFQAEDAIIRLAHAKMPQPPCGCGTIQEMWSRDRKVPDVLDTARLNCPFGLSDGAWVAWKFANAIRIQRGLLI